MSPGATERAARHCSVRATITQEMWDVVHREQQAKRMRALTGLTERECLFRLFESGVVCED